MAIQGVRSVDIGPLLRVKSEEARINAMIAQRKRREAEIADARRRAKKGKFASNVGALGGAVIGGFYGGPAGAAGGAAIGSEIGGQIGGRERDMDVNTLVQGGAQIAGGVEQKRIGEERDAQRKSTEETNQALIDQAVLNLSQSRGQSAPQATVADDFAPRATGSPQASQQQMDIDSRIAQIQALKNRDLSRVDPRTLSSVIDGYMPAGSEQFNLAAGGKRFERLPDGSVRELASNPKTESGSSPNAGKGFHAVAPNAQGGFDILGTFTTQEAATTAAIESGRPNAHAIAVGTSAVSTQESPADAKARAEETRLKEQLAAEFGLGTTFEELTSLRNSRQVVTNQETGAFQVRELPAATRLAKFDSIFTEDNIASANITPAKRTQLEKVRDDLETEVKRETDAEEKSLARAASTPEHQIFSRTSTGKKAIARLETIVGRTLSDEGKAFLAGNPGASLFDIAAAGGLNATQEEIEEATLDAVKGDIDDNKYRDVTSANAANRYYNGERDKRTQKVADTLPAAAQEIVNGTTNQKELEKEIRDMPHIDSERLILQLRAMLTTPG